MLREILRGGADAAADAGVAVVGGHSIDDPEPKYGLAVTGVVHPDELVRNSTARAGDELWLTKPVGGGAATTALKRKTAPPGLEERVVIWKHAVRNAMHPLVMALGVQLPLLISGDSARASPPRP